MLKLRSANQCAGPIGEAAQCNSAGVRQQRAGRPVKEQLQASQPACSWYRYYVDIGVGIGICIGISIGVVIGVGKGVVQPRQVMEQLQALQPALCPASDRVSDLRTSGAAQFKGGQASGISNSPLLSFKEKFQGLVKIGS